MPSRHVAARRIDVWLPPSYALQPERRYPVLYLHDGQNLFDGALSYGGVDWDIDGVMTREVAAGRVREAIVVGIWNTPSRFQEYMPAKAVPPGPIASGVAGFDTGLAQDLQSDAYLAFLVEELKPRVDARYRTLSGPADTAVMGSSMGGLISLYALAEYPAVFGAAGGVSTHWPAGDGAVVDWLAQRLPAPGAHRLYFDFGTVAVDASYAPYQAAMDAHLRQRGYVQGRDFVTRRFEGAAHNEEAWQRRVHEPLQFLLGPPRD
ncbi:alpha/beta hydrolase-fold protein [Arenimonas sp.]|uniref:alpha/beta hydrolase n=1 Tax=Arenimonas sp. TaxID=1872635 RepID=UPI0025C32843|nr:alpha/beta hydrolase-fold protein [Arenimonas sp.]